MSENWLFLPSPSSPPSTLWLVLTSLSPLQKADTLDFFSFISLVSQNSLGRDSHCWHFWHPPRSSFPEKWAAMCARACFWVCYFQFVSMCRSQWVNLSDPCICVRVCDPIHLSVCMIGRPCFFFCMQSDVFPNLLVHVCAFIHSHVYMCQWDLCICVASEYVVESYILCVGFQSQQVLKKIREANKWSNVPL